MPAHPCAGLSKSACLVHDGAALCSCPAGTVDVGGSCLAATPCAPNPCQVANQSTCVSDAGTARCRCSPGYSPVGDACATTPVWSCASKHVGALEDAAEPDECPALASSLGVGLPAQRSLAPPGDHDWQ